MRVESIQGLHLFMIHNPERSIQRVWNLRRADGVPRLHKLMVHNDTCEWLSRMPPDTNWIIRNWNLSEQRLTDAETAVRLGREHAQAHHRYMLSAEAQGVSRERLYFEGRNEPQPAEFPFVCDYEISRIQEAERLGIPHLVVHNIGVGQPNTRNWHPAAGVDWDQLLPLKRALRPGDLWGVHHYWELNGPNTLWPDGDHDMRWPQEGFRLLHCPWQDVRFVLTENGIDDGVRGNQKVGWHGIPAGSLDEKARIYIEHIKWAERQYLGDGRIVAALLFTHDYENNEWEKFDITHDAFWRLYEPYVKGGVEVTMWGDNRTDRWRPLVEERAKRHGLDPLVVATILALESAGRVDAISSVGAVGLMQVMPDTAIAGRPSKEVLLNPDQNIEWGCRILAGNMQTAKGDLQWALCYYYGAKGGPTSTAGKEYLGTFRRVWGELWPGRDCPIDGTAHADMPEPIGEDLRQLLLSGARANQLIQFNPDAALQKAIFRDGYVPNSPEFDVSIDGTSYRGQRAEHLGSGAVRVYFAKVGDWGNVKTVS